MPDPTRSSFARRPDEPLAAVIVSDADCRPRGSGFAIACYAAELTLAALLAAAVRRTAARLAPADAIGARGRDPHDRDRR